MSQFLAVDIWCLFAEKLPQVVSVEYLGTKSCIRCLNTIYLTSVEPVASLGLVLLQVSDKNGPVVLAQMLLSPK